MAIELLSGKEKYWKEQKEIIRIFKEEGRRNEIQEELKKLEKNFK